MNRTDSSGTRRCGVTIVTGLPGAGKTTAALSLAEQFGVERVAVVSNELTKLNHDAEAYRAIGLPVLCLNGECATQRPDALAEAIDRAVGLIGTDTGRVIVELAGCGTTAPLLVALAAHGAADWSIDGVVTVVDARTVMDNRLEVDTDSPQRGIISKGALLEHQTRASTTNVLNFADQASPATLEEAVRWLDTVNPEAIIETSDDGLVRASTVVDPVWSPPQAESRASAQAPLRSMVYESRRPFHPVRLKQAIEGGAMLSTRSKGAIWVATDQHRSLVWDQLGLDASLSPGRSWWASTPPSAWPADRSRWAEIFHSWAEPWGDRRQSLSIIGEDLERGRTALALQACELTDEEMAMGPGLWATWQDPFEGRPHLRLAA